MPGSSGLGSVPDSVSDNGCTVCSEVDSHHLLSHSCQSTTAPGEERCSLTRNRQSIFLLIFLTSMVIGFETLLTDYLLDFCLNCNNFQHVMSNEVNLMAMKILLSPMGKNN